MSVIIIKQTDVYYEVKGNRGKNVILLHGWGQNTKMMDYIAEFLKSHFIVYNLDFPGFGNSPEPKDSWSNEDYTEMLHEFVNELKIENPIIIAHSFGSRVSLYYAYKYPVYKMVLTGAAGIKDKHNIEWYIKVYSYKLAKLLLKPFKGLSEKLRNKAGSSDYKNASAIMKDTLVKCVNFDITPYLKDIKPETLLVFGEKDEATPLWMGKKLEKLMPNATLVTFENEDHFAYFREPDRFNRVLEAYLGADYE